MRSECENNENRINNVQSVLMNKEDQIALTTAKINEAHSVIQENKYHLNKLDGELGYFEA